MDDSFDLQRFVKAQAPVFDSVCAELRSGRKAGCWMWFVFPQLRGLGFSPTSKMFGISSLAEAEAYLLHPLLGSRLQEVTGLVQAIDNASANEIFGSPDDLKFRSCMTLFSCAKPESDVFSTAIRKYFRGEPDRRTIELLSKL